VPASPELRGNASVIPQRDRAAVTVLLPETLPPGESTDRSTELGPGIGRPWTR
jgi:hypothetical protein